MMKRETFAIANIYVPVKRRATLDPKKAQEIAESILQVGLQSPILVRQDGERFVLVEGLHRLEAYKRLARKPSSDTSCRPASINDAAHSPSPSVARRRWPE
jgi:sulfiredoxin